MASDMRKRRFRLLKSARRILPGSTSGKVTLAACVGAAAPAIAGAVAFAVLQGGLMPAMPGILAVGLTAFFASLVMFMVLRSLLSPLYSLEKRLEFYKDHGLHEDLPDDGSPGQASNLVDMVDGLLSNFGAELRQTQTAADTDPLTGLLNRRGFDRRRHPGDRGSIVFVDLDHFKQVNDQLGHDAGDLVLSATADLLRSVLREDEIVARFGGEEFVVFLPEIELEQARLVAERIRSSAERSLATTLGRVTISAGVASKGAEESFAQALSRADRAVYQAKKAGRNRVHISDDTSECDIEPSVPVAAAE